MGDLAEATRVEQSGANTFEAELSPDWEIWGPNGGYLASVALRVAGITSERARPVSIHAHFVGAGRTGPVQLRTEVNRSTKVATSVTVHLEQEGRPWLVATVWRADDDLPGLEHQTGDKPMAPDPAELPNMATLMAGRDEVPHAFWSNVEQRPLGWIEDWEKRHRSVRRLHQHRIVAAERSVSTSGKQRDRGCDRQDLDQRSNARGNRRQHLAFPPCCPSPRQVSSP